MMAIKDGFFIEFPLDTLSGDVVKQYGTASVVQEVVFPPIRFEASIRIIFYALIHMEKIIESYTLNYMPLFGLA